ncbi:unnamed protein product [Rotaria sordida]|uniref:F-box domain-containing protein n=1 Tax=Rotaria sordida TaxID=392033 RepID=A0A815FQV2_9BILA|nr:unnamed protein product [Rotaria sordida]
MNQIKRKLTLKKSSKKKTKKLRNELDQPIISIENLSNEIFYEIFDYLNGIDIYNAFAGLNHRFQQLLYSSSLRFKIELDYSTSEEIFMNTYKQVILHHRHQIFSFYSWASDHINKIILSCTIDSSFNCLESIILNDIDFNVLSLLLMKLADLPRLFSLSISTTDSLEELSNIYELIFALPKLYYLQFLTEPCEYDFETTVSLPIASCKQFSTIKHLFIDHPCTFNELFVIMSYTPELSRLNFWSRNENYSDIEMVLPITLPNLTFISLDTSCISFDEFEMLITKIHCPLKVLYLGTRFENIAFLDANRWEQLIQKYFPQLKKFSFHCYEHIKKKYGFPLNLIQRDRFTSSFWLKQQWIFEVHLDNTLIHYLIHPYRKRWYEDTPTKTINSCMDVSKSTRLIIKSNLNKNDVKLFNININRIRTIAKVYHLEINGEIFLRTLLDILLLLPQLHSLKISSLVLPRRTYLTEYEAEILSFISNDNKIKELCLDEIVNVNELHFLIRLCHYMNYFQINSINNIDVELFVRTVLMEMKVNYNHQLRSLYFHVPLVNDEIIRKLEKMINSEKLLLDYTIKYVFDKIYLEWK